MALPSPNLDDRNFDQIVEEAIRLIPQYCPEWTNYNPSDPGITLVELFAWLTEMMLYRINRIPDRVYLVLLDLIGIRLRPPQPAEAMLTFYLAEGASKPQWVPRGTQVCTEQADEGEAIIFETKDDLCVTNTKLVKIVSIDSDKVSDNTENMTGDERVPFEAFAGAKQMDRFLYIGDDRFGSLKEASTIECVFTCPKQKDEEFTDLVAWEYWNGRRWKELVTSQVPEEELREASNISGAGRGITFTGPVEDIANSELEDIDTTWIRAELIEVPINDDDTVLDEIKLCAMILQDGVEPDHSFLNSGGDIFMAVDLSKNFYPLGEEPKFDNVIYLASDEVFSKDDSLVRIEFVMTDPSLVPFASPSPNCQIRWEYYNGRRWEEISTSTVYGAKEPVQFNFVDTTKCFQKNGWVSFLRPEFMKQCEVNGVEAFWVRGLLYQGDYGSRGKYEAVVDPNTGQSEWIWKEDRPLRPPSIKSMVLKYSQVPFSARHILTYNDFTYRDYSHIIDQPGRAFQPFLPIREENPAMYCGFDRQFPNSQVSIYFRVEESRVEFDEQALDEPFPEEGLIERQIRTKKQDQRILWEFWNGQHWASLTANDDTSNLTLCGLLKFTGPNGHTKKREFGQELFWVRARFEMGSYSKAPIIEDIRLNTTASLNAMTVFDEILGHSDGTPDQQFRFAQQPVLPGQSILVRENEIPPKRELKKIYAEEGETAIKQIKDDAGNTIEVWIRWHQVDSFYNSGPNSRHYLIDPLTGEVRFGDGRRGMIPPMGNDNMKAAQYLTGGGGIGNVGAGSLTVLRQSIAYIDSVVNHHPAVGGADQETIDEAKMRGPHVVKNRYRAVTAEDFEWLSVRASGNVARAKAMASPKKEGELTILILPKEEKVIPDMTRPLVPTPELIRKVKDFLDVRRLITTKLHVGKPRYIEISVDIQIVLKQVGGRGTTARRQIEEAVRRFLHPVLGGADMSGWPFGRSLHKSDLYHVVERVEGVDYIEDLSLFDEDRRLTSDKIELKEDELLHVVDVNVEEVTKEVLV